MDPVGAAVHNVAVVDASEGTYVNVQVDTIIAMAFDGWLDDVKGGSVSFRRDRTVSSHTVFVCPFTNSSRRPESGYGTHAEGYSS